MADSPDFQFNTAVDDELFDDLAQLAGQRIVYAAVWEDSMADSLVSLDPSAPPSGAAVLPDSTFDLDLYLADGLYFELYSVSLFPDSESEPIAGRTSAEARIQELMRVGMTLGEVAVDEEDALVLILHDGAVPCLYLDVGAFVLEEWDELPV